MRRDKMKHKRKCGRYIIMDNAKRHTDEFLSEVLRAMWMYLLFSALRLFGTVCLMNTCPSLALGYYNRIPEMLEHLLAGCAVTVALGAAFQYFSAINTDL